MFCTDVHVVLDTNKTYPKRRDYLFSFNLNLDLLTLALENLYFNTLDLEKVLGKSLSCIKSREDTSPSYCTTTLQGATADGWKRDEAREPRVADPCTRSYEIKRILDNKNICLQFFIVDNVD